MIKPLHQTISHGVMVTRTCFLCGGNIRTTIFEKVRGVKLDCVNCGKSEHVYPEKEGYVPPEWTTVRGTSIMDI